MKIVVIADVGAQTGYHAGDEAMLEAMLIELGSRVDLEAVILSGNPDDSRARYAHDSIDRMGFGSERTPTRADREARLAAVLEAAKGTTAAIDWQDPAWRVIDSIAGCDAVVIAGGGNLSSLWQEHVYERAALSMIATVFHKPLVVTGQTIGPALLGRDGELVGAIVTGAVLVGVREHPSYDIALQLGVPAERLRLNADDASFLPADDRPETVLGSSFTPPSSDYAVATFAGSAGADDPQALLAHLAEIAEHITVTLGLELVLLPHEGSLDPDGPRGDLGVHEKVAGMRGLGTSTSPRCYQHSRSSQSRRGRCSASQPGTTRSCSRWPAMYRA